MYHTINMLGYQRPVIEIMGHPALIDTGAIIPMTNFSPEVLTILYNAELVSKNKSIGGIEGKSNGDIYTLHNFKVGPLNFKKLDVFVPYNRDFRFAFLLSASMFHGLKYSFDMMDDKKQTFSIKIAKDTVLNKEFSIKELNGQLLAQVDGVLLQNDFDMYQNIDNFEQEY